MHSFRFNRLNRHSHGQIRFSVWSSVMCLKIWRKKCVAALPTYKRLSVLRSPNTHTHTKSFMYKIIEWTVSGLGSNDMVCVELKVVWANTMQSNDRRISTSKNDSRCEKCLFLSLLLSSFVVVALFSFCFIYFTYIFYFALCSVALLLLLLLSFKQYAFDTILIFVPSHAVNDSAVVCKHQNCSEWDWKQRIANGSSHIHASLVRHIMNWLLIEMDDECTLFLMCPLRVHTHSLFATMRVDFILLSFFLHFPSIFRSLVPLSHTRAKWQFACGWIHRATEGALHTFLS